jgi:hypothetical protein
MDNPGRGPRSLARWPVVVTLAAAVAAAGAVRPADAQWVRRDARWPIRGPWRYALPRELPDLYREFNGIDFGHAHLAETLLRSEDRERAEQARLEVLEFIFSSPRVPPDEVQIAPTFTRLAWEAQRAFDWAHALHRSLYDLFTSDSIEDKAGAYRAILEQYLATPEAITLHRLDHHGKLWNFPESRSFRDKFPKFNSQIWVYHWLQAAVYDVQLMRGADAQRQRIPRIIEHYHNYLREPPLQWEFMPLLPEGAPEFSRRFPEAAAIFDNLHMLHDNIDDILSRRDLYPDRRAQREAILKILPIYLHRNHFPEERHAEYELPSGADGHAGHGGGPTGPRPPSAAQVLSASEGENSHKEH